MSIYEIYPYTLDDFDIDFLDSTIMSAYFQGVVWISLGYMMHSVRIEDIDFDVYKNDVAVT